MSAEALNRGDFVRLATSVGLGLTLEIGTAPSGAAAARVNSVFAPNIWVRVAPDDAVTVIVSKSEMGQGVVMGFSTIVADELDADPRRIRTEFAPPDARYADPAFHDQATGGSVSTSGAWLPLRKAGATARAMLVAAAAKQWRVKASECTTHNSVVVHAASKRRASYGSLALAASALPVPVNVPLKPSDRFTLIGKSRQRLDIPSKVNGSAQFGIDVRLPGMVYAAVARSPVFGGRLRTFDARKAQAVRGVIKVVKISSGVAVVAKNTWAAFQGKLALSVAWDEGSNATVDSHLLFAEAERAGKDHTNERVALSRGNPAIEGGHVVEAVYRGPFLAHATMEPMNTTALVSDGRCEVWSPNQVQRRAQAAAAAGSGLPPEKCIVHTTLLGGGFGRRLEVDYVQEAVEIAKAVHVPVKLVWTREDDIQHDFYRPMSVNTVRGLLNQGQLVSLSHQVVQPSWLRRWFPHPPIYVDGLDTLGVESVADAPYAIPNIRVSYIDYEHGIPIGSWRAPNANWNDFVTESFVDELAHTAGADPLAFRLRLLTQNPRAANVLRLAASKAGWGSKRPNVGQGLALTFWAGSYAAMVAEISMQDKMPRVHRVIAAVDVGTVVNPDIIIQQSQGATNFGLSAALTGKITIKNGRCEQNNFYDYTVLRMADAPKIEVHVVHSNEPPTGVGELCTPPIAPAVGNAIFALTGKRVRSLPFSDALV
jgi:isoquinoline 1-oxidoreductase subunit beta